MQSDQRSQGGQRLLQVRKFSLSPAARRPGRHCSCTAILQAAHRMAQRRVLIAVTRLQRRPGVSEWKSRRRQRPHSSFLQLECRPLGACDAKVCLETIFMEQSS